MRQSMDVVVAICLFSLCMTKCWSKETSNSVAALYAFGDSLVENGNNNNLPAWNTAAKANYKPYGVDYPGAVPTGRVSNGKTVPDLFAEFLGLPHPIPAKPTNQPISLTGYSYGSAGAGILPDTSPFPGILTLMEQVRLFEVTKETKLRPAFNNDTAELENHLANSIFFVWVGNNDYLLNYFYPTKDTSTRYTPEEFAELLNSTLSERLEELYGLGARKIVVFEVAPVGCIPASVDASGRCNETRNSIVTLFNTKLALTLKSLSSQLPHSYISLGKTYDITLHAVHNPAEYGLTNVTSPCCELRVVGAITALQCKLFGGTYCPNRDEYLFWDAAHPSEVAFRLLSEECITNSEVCFPYSIRDLAQLTVTPSSSLLSSA